ncbi:hypothetical protein [Chroogloeocystis siderophila]|jgi:hypothetical protein|uniref:Uncharacterized protein n=1 Tax=Chroogloeocystis siderophila 5.2 s.c.1 TaxID=247279 RepID=A0A1U7HWJ9_9CHRO|nr:hypothetical protein [Chroogloeocystis siderophila]OKH27973.1 hypothetical protein NIES1031_05160 [Chroogloeocystis siderophila 5.2 s.c.1]
MNPLNLHDSYPCPVCRFGQIAALPLMDAMACNLCQQIFEVDLERQQIKMSSRQPALLWNWNGSWCGAHLEGVELGWGYVFAAIALVLLPPTLMGLVIFIHPPAPNTPLSWLPYVWAGLGFLAHLAIVGWLVIEFYQFPLGLWLRRLPQQLLQRIRNS